MRVIARDVSLGERVCCGFRNTRLLFQTFLSLFDVYFFLPMVCVVVEVLVGVDSFVVSIVDVAVEGISSSSFSSSGAPEKGQGQLP